MARSEKIRNILKKIDPKEKSRIEKRMMLAAKISYVLKDKSISQKQFAEMLGKKPSEISKWLSGTHNFTIDSISDIEHTLKVQLLDTKIDDKYFMKEIDFNEITLNVIIGSTTVINDYIKYSMSNYNDITKKTYRKSNKLMIQ